MRPGPHRRPASRPASRPRWMAPPAPGASAAGAASGSGSGSAAGSGFGRRRGFGGRCRPGAASVTDHREFRTDLGGLVLGDDDLLEDPGERGGNLGVDLVGGDLDQGLVDGDLVADFLEPAGDSAFGDALTESRHLHGVRHGFSSLPWSTSGYVVRLVLGQLCTCSGLPAIASIASPMASYWVGWAWTSGATSSG